jgi:hypothetical protein
LDVHSFVLHSLIILSALSISAPPKAIAAPADRPNVLFILVDDLSWNDLSYNGSNVYETPNVDRLSTQGMVFTDFYSAGPVCSPTRASIMTGKYPARTGITTYLISPDRDAPHVTSHLPLAEFTIAEAFKKNGCVHRLRARCGHVSGTFRANGYRTLAAGEVNHGLGEPDPRLWDENGPDCGVLGTPFVGDELDTAAMTPTRVINRGNLKITLPANGGLSAIDRPNNKWDSFDWAPLDEDNSIQ